jgi:hypothetical protein
VTAGATASEVWRAVMAQARRPVDEPPPPPVRACRRVKHDAGCVRCGATWNMKYPAGMCVCPGGPVGPWPPPDPDWVPDSF